MSYMVETKWQKDPIDGCQQGKISLRSSRDASAEDEGISASSPQEERGREDEGRSKFWRGVGSLRNGAVQKKEVDFVGGSSQIDHWCD